MTPSSFLSLLTWMKNDFDGQVTIDMLLTFFFVASRGTCTQNELEEALGYSNSGASRNVSWWTERTFDRRPGKGFIRREIDPDDMRYRRLELTKKGREFYAQLQEKIR
jgi:DNA-binding MarR family transcriptional regulator